MADSGEEWGSRGYKTSDGRYLCVWVRFSSHDVNFLSVPEAMMWSWGLRIIELLFLLQKIWDA